ncbi:MAG TPA: NrfD/PsrC family molybdoenzyme membrane anchor subunit [Syntrophomonadaceae bacterium]|nr:NrfD/PsrC family molybdoenzyme membrane anchor subunit [Syntrophomonadaceae bacterium]
METKVENNVATNKRGFTWSDPILALIIMAGLVMWILSLQGNPGTNSLNDFAPWGIYIALFIFFEAIAAGTMVIAAIMNFIKVDVLSQKRLLLVGLVSALCAGLAIIADLGSPFVAWRLFFTPVVSAPMILDVWFVSLIIISGIVLWWALSKDKAQVAKGSSIVLIVSSLLLPLATSWLFTSLPGKLAWTGTIEFAVFLLQAGLAGVCVFYLLQKNNDSFKEISRNLVIFFITINLLLLLGQIGSTLYASGTSTLSDLALISGTYKFVFWGQLLVCLVLPLALFLTRKTMLVASYLVLGGIAVSKYLFIAKGNHMPFLQNVEGIDIPMLLSGNAGYKTLALYAPVWQECIIVLAIASLFALSIGIGIRMFIKN